MRKRTIITSAGAAVLAVLLVSTLATRQAPAKEAAGFRRPLTFEPNLGQTDAKVSFLTRGGHALWIMGDSATLGLPGQKGAIRMKWMGGNTHANAKGVDPMVSTSNYLIGDQSKWRTGVPNYSRVRLDEVYPGIDLLFHPSTDRNLEYDFEVAPGADPTRIAVEFEGSTGLHLEANGDLRIDTAAGAVLQRKPVAYQGEGGSRRNVAAVYEIQRDQVRIRLGDYDRSRALIIDPTLQFSTYMGGPTHDRIIDMAADGAGNTFVAAMVSGVNLPTPGGLAGLGSGTERAYIARYDASGALTFATYTGGPSYENLRGIAVDGLGAIYLSFPDKPEIPPVGACGTSSGEGFRAKLLPAGTSFVYACPANRTIDVALTAAGQEYWLTSDGCVDSGAPAATTQLKCYPKIGNWDIGDPAFALDPTGGFWITRNIPSTVGTDIFLAKVGRNWVNVITGQVTWCSTCQAYATTWGGPGDDRVAAVAVNHAGAAYITGSTKSANLPGLSSSLSGDRDAFIAKFTTSSSTPQSGAYVGGPNYDEGHGIALRTVGFGLFTSTSAYIIGTSYGPFYAGAGPPPCTAGLSDMFIFKYGGVLDPGWSACIGGSGYDGGGAVAVSSSNGVRRVHVGGTVDGPISSPLLNPSQPTFGGWTDVFVAMYVE